MVERINCGLPMCAEECAIKHYLKTGEQHAVDRLMPHCPVYNPAFTPRPEGEPPVVAGPEEAEALRKKLGLRKLGRRKPKGK